MSKLKEILSGWANLALDKIDLLSEDIKAEAERRAIICNTCPVRKMNYCDTGSADQAVVDFIYNGEKREKGTYYQGCGCHLDAKTMSPTTKCPLGKWERASTFIEPNGVRYTIMHLPPLTNAENRIQSNNESVYEAKQTGEDKTNQS